jgi:hypothetical protein
MLLIFTPVSGAVAVGVLDSAGVLLGAELLEEPPEPPQPAVAMASASTIITTDGLTNEAPSR